GADVAHPGPGIFTRPSVASVVASYDSNWAKYGSYLDMQAPRLEYIENIEAMMRVCTPVFLTLSAQTLPGRLIFYRDGLSEGEYDTVAAAERDAIQSQLSTSHSNTIKGAPPFRLTFIIVAKRHHIRFLPEVQAPRENVPPGLLVSEGVIGRVYDNFYLVSQAGILGTSRPTHYVVRERAQDMTLELCQDLSYFLTHINARTTRSVALPAPVHCKPTTSSEQT
ncbi:Piwi domain-containing protein, partial [Vararia minispora EC-137]